MHLHQHIHAQLRREDGEFAHPGILQGGDNQQDGVRADDTRLDHLIGIHGEILAQHRQRAGGARLLEMLVGALEKIHVGQHRQAGGAVAFITPGDVGRPEIRAQQALAGARLLDLGDDRGTTGGKPAPDRL